MNIPYTRQQKITKDQPYLNKFPNRSTRRKELNKSLSRETNNRKTTQLVVTNLGNGQFDKTKKQIIVFPKGYYRIGGKLEYRKTKTIVMYN